MSEGFDPSVPNEVGKLLFHDDDGTEYTGLMIVSDDTNAVPIEVVPIPDPIQDEFSFTVVLSPALAHFFGALQAAEAGTHVSHDVLMASRLLWWTSVRVAVLTWKEMNSHGSA